MDVPREDLEDATDCDSSGVTNEAMEGVNVGVWCGLPRMREDAANSAGDGIRVFRYRVSGSNNSRVRALKCCPSNSVASTSVGK